MKNLILIFMLLCFANFSFAQEDYYKKQWDAVAKLENEGLTKSTSELVDKIRKKAVKDNNAMQGVKTLFYQSKYMLILEEEAQLKIVNNFKSEIEKSDSVTKHLLENLLATMYWQYFQQNRYRFYNRTKTETKADVNDFRTWDLETLFNEIHTYYQRSLQNGLLLQQESLNQYGVLLVEHEYSKTFRPTLFDLLSHNALEFYKTDENTITKPAYKFQIDNTKYLADSETFINLELAAKDSSSLQLNALKIYQNLLKFHHKDQASKAFVNVDIDRLNFVKQHATFDKVNDILITTLRAKQESLKSSPLSTLYAFEIASTYKQQGNTYHSSLNHIKKDTTNRWKLKDAIAVCDTTISKFPNSLGSQKCSVLKQQIQQPSINLSAERFVPARTKSRVLVNYKNLQRLDFKIYKVRISQLKAFSKLYKPEEQKQFLSQLNVVKDFSSTLLDKYDYQSHSIEIIIPELDNGLYLIKAETNTDDVFGTAHIQVANVALIESQEDKQIVYQAINRMNGQPFTNAKVEISYYKNQTKHKSNQNFKTDRFGRFTFIKDHNRYREVEVKITTSNETALFGDYYINKNYKRQKNKDTQYRTFLFTDRSIYKPGQTTYFKGIVSRTKDGKTTVASDEILTAALYNVNGEKLSEVKFVTNEFGSFHGEFILPKDGLTGQFYIRTASATVGSGSQYFSVEDYKRPKFEVTFNPVTETYKVNDSVTVRGSTLAFAGSNITDAKVVYRVKRNVQYPRWCYWRMPYYSVEAQNIAFGESKTNAKGEFDITFKALPDESADKANLPVFQYEITADITDLNGETRSATTSVSIGYHALMVNVITPQTIDKSKKETEISISSRNLNGQYAPAKGHLKIYKLNAPKNVLRPRPWGAPDYQTLSETEFKTLFPNDPYKNEHLLVNWKKGELVFESDFDTEKSTTVVLKKIKTWDSGKYIVLLESKDKFGQNVKDEAFTSLYSDYDKTLADKQLFLTQLNKTSYKAGEIAKLTLGSASKDMTVTVDIEKDGKTIVSQLVSLNDSKKTISIPVLENDLGGFVVHCSFAAFNYFQSNLVYVNVPYPKTDLEIETKTFRDKLQPGQDETWSFKIKGPKGDKVSAELLASMYDVSLDEFRAHGWYFNPIYRPNYYSQTYKNSRESFGTTNFRFYTNFSPTGNYPHQNYDQLNWFGFYFGNNYRYQYKRKGIAVEAIMVEESAELEEVAIAGAPAHEADGVLNTLVNDEKWTTKNSTEPNRGQDIPRENLSDPSNIKIRKNLQETAFFFPQLQTDANGNVSFNFRTPEALTKWKLQLLAHTKTLESTVMQLEAVTQKELMVIPNAPRFLREGDQITLSTKIANLTDEQLSGSAQLVLTDALTGKEVSKLLMMTKALHVKEDKDASSKTSAAKEFTVDAKGNTQVSWQLSIPKDFQAIQYKVIAKANSFSDGEQNVLPVLSNRMLVTETLPMWIRSDQTKAFTLAGLQNNSSKTLKHHKLTLEITSNPAWYAVQALPYLMEFPHECNEQTFARYYANALARHIVKSNPKIEAVFNHWASSAPTISLLSNLEKNQELKSLLIQETPWLRDAQSEAEQKKRIALLFDLNKMNNELQSAKRKLKNNQMLSGAWPWFNGGPENRYITQHIISGFGHLKQLSVMTSEVETSKMVQKAINYLDAEFVKEYKNLKKYNDKVDLKKDHLSYTQLHYLYVRSFYPELKTSKEVKTIMDYYKGQIQKYWLKRSLYAKGLMALIMHRMDDIKTANNILRSLKENSITSDELGMYWKANTASWYWYQAPIETQALLIEAFSEIENDTKTIDNLKIWLLKNRQTNKWTTTKATTEAVYALLLQGNDWLNITDMVDVSIGNEAISPSKLNKVNVEAGTGYYKTSWNGSEIKPVMANVTISKKGEGMAWGALYWQYFEDLDKITSTDLTADRPGTPLKLKKKLFLKTNTDKGEQISEITSETQLKVGDLVRVRIELHSDRAMEFVHLKDMRAAGLEPINVLSQYKWQDGLGYYESTRDAATNFFIDYLPKGIYIFEYDLRVNNAGEMSNGISTIQSMYAPEFSSHSEGKRISVD